MTDSELLVWNRAIECAAQVMDEHAEFLKAKPRKWAQGRVGEFLGFAKKIRDLKHSAQLPPT